jgi:hypothetical protein
MKGVSMKKIKFVLFVLLIILTTVCGCENSRGKNDCWAGVPYYNVDELVNDWYAVQKGKIKDVPKDKRITNEDSRHHYLYLAFAEQPVLPVIRSKTDEYVLHSIAVYDTCIQYAYTYRDPKISDPSLVFTIQFGEDSYEDFMEVNGLNDSEKTGSNKNSSSHHIDLGYARLSFSPYGPVDFFDINVIFDYFEYNVIDSFEYESQMK